MHPLSLPLLADENVAPDVVGLLRADGLDVVTALDRGLGGRSDAEVLDVATREGRVVLTHDSDFGAIAIRAGRAFVGILFVRPGHIAAARVVEQIRAVVALPIEASPPFVLVAERRGAEVRVRLRQLASPSDG